MSNPHHSEHEPRSLGDLLSQRDNIQHNLADFTVVAQFAEQKNREIISILSREAHGRRSPFIVLTEKEKEYGEPVLLYRNAQILTQREEVIETKKRRKKNAPPEETPTVDRQIKKHYQVGFVGITRFGLFVVRFPEIELYESHLKGFNSPDESFPYIYGSRVLMKLGTVLRSFDQEELRSEDVPSGEEHKLYIICTGFQMTSQGKVPTFTIKRNVPWDRDKNDVIFDAEKSESSAYIAPFEDELGRTLFVKIIEEYQQELEKAKQRKLGIIDTVERVLPSIEKKEESD